MAKKKNLTMNYIALFVLGAVVGAAILYAASYSSYSNWPGYYMMPMMQNMMGYQSAGTNINCASLTEAQLKEFGDTFMIQMMGQQFEEQMDARLSEETSQLMHLAMGRMYLGC